MSRRLLASMPLIAKPLCGACRQAGLDGVRSEEPKPKLFGPDIAGLGGGLPRA